MGVWNPAGGEPRPGSGLPVDEGREEMRVLTLSTEGRIRNISPNQLEESLRDPASVVWVDILRPHEGAEALQRDTLRLGPLTVEDCSQPLRMPKMNALPEGGAFIAAFAVRLDEVDEPRLRAEEVDLVVGPGYLVTVRDGPLGEVEERFRSQILAAQAWLESPGFSLAHAALDALVDGHAPVMVRTAAAAEELEESLDPRDERSSIAALEALITLRRDLLAFRRLAVAQQEILRRLGRAVPELREYLSDVADNQREAVDMADARLRGRGKPWGWPASTGRTR